MKKSNVEGVKQYLENVDVSRRALTTAILGGGAVAALGGLSSCVTAPQPDETNEATSELLGTTNPRWVDFLSDLVNVNSVTTKVVIVRNHSAGNDGGGGLFRWCTGTAAANKGTIVVPATPNGGYWKRVYGGSIIVRGSERRATT